MASTPSIVLLILAFLAISVKSHVNSGDGPGCAHHLFTEKAELLDVEEEYLPQEDRLLATTAYKNLRIATDFTRLTLGSTAFKNYVKNDLVPPVIDFFSSALAVKQPLTSALKVSASTICGYATPTALKNGALTDFFVIVSSTSDEANWVASAGSCSLASGTKRPIIARMLFNMVYTKDAKDDVLLHEKNMYLTMHEMMHALGFSGSSFENYIDASGNPLRNHLKSVILNGETRTILNVEPLTTKLRKHYGCTTLEGAYLENDGGAGTEGSHFERRHFLYDTMTSGVIDGRRITEFDLAVLEGSGWYVPDYDYAEPFYFGQGQGCNFLKLDCSARTFDFDDFCDGSSRGCTNAGRGGGICTTDTRSDGCRYYIPNDEYDCENADAAENARYPELQVFGRGAGSRCFNGDLTKLSSSSQTSFCFKYNCVGTGLATTLEVLIGSGKVTCKKQGELRLSGYNGALYCPDPLTFCSTVGKKYCPRNCMGRGTCINNQCKCDTGYKGIDCALNV